MTTTSSTTTVSEFIPALPFYSLKNAEEVSRTATKELLRVATWLEDNISDHATRMETQQKEKVMGKKVNLLAGCPESQPFWTDHNKMLQCFVCDFTQKWNQTFIKTEDLHWMTKRIRRDDASIVISLCPSCISGEPWILHSKNSFTNINIVK